jgi:hypothetical protein
MLSPQLTTGHQSFRFIKFFWCIIVAQLARNGRTNHWMKPSLPVPRTIYQIAESGRRVRKEDIQDGDRPLRLPQMFWNTSSGCHVSFILLIQSTCIHYNSMPWQYEFQLILIHYKCRSKLEITKQNDMGTALWFTSSLSVHVICLDALRWCREINMITIYVQTLFISYW